MAEKFVFPMLSVNGDRMYDDTDFATFYFNIFTSGVIATVRNQLRVSEDDNTGMRVKVNTGAIFIQGRQMLLSEPEIINITPGSNATDRTDLIVVQLDLLSRDINVIYKQGTTSLRRDENYWEMQLARIDVPRNATAIYNSYITDTRSNESVCGYSKLQGNLNVEGLEQQYRNLLEQAFVEFESSADTNQLNLEQLLTNQQALFQGWLNGLQDELDSNQATNLQNQINALKPTETLVTINHNLGYYPQVQVLYWEYGLGTVPLEEQPEGVSWDGTAPETIPTKVSHPSRNKAEIHVPIDYAMLNPSVTEINDGYLLQEGIKSMRIEIGGN